MKAVKEIGMRSYTINVIPLLGKDLGDSSSKEGAAAVNAGAVTDIVTATRNNKIIIDGFCISIFLLRAIFLDREFQYSFRSINSKTHAMNATPPGQFTVIFSYGITSN